MRADVGDCAERAAERRIEPPVPVRRLVQPVLDVRPMGVPDAADVSAANARSGLVAERIEADVVVRAVHEATLLGQLHELGRLLRGDGERLLADDVLAGGEHGLHLRVVQVVRSGQVDDVDLVVRQHRLERLVRLR
jgi:hypothetical protein